MFAFPPLKVGPVAARDPSLGWATYLDFRRGIYRDAGGRRALSALNGYSYSRTNTKAEEIYGGGNLLSFEGLLWPVFWLFELTH